MRQRAEAAQVMQALIKEEGVIQFILKSFNEGEWRFNVPALWENYATISGWEAVPAWPHPALFIRGGDSPYLDNHYRDVLLRQFPDDHAHVISGAGH
nr:LexA regulated protein [Candidatus Pantoea persica]